MARMTSGGGGGRRGGGMNMDALISAALSRGDPSSMPPPTRGPAMPTASPSPAASPAAGSDPRLRAMLQSIYRSGGTPRAAAPPPRSMPPQLRR
jgi:hypothetical protein